MPDTAGGAKDDPQADAAPIHGSRNSAQPGALSATEGPREAQL